jgi:hypothetical protein
MAYRTRSKRKIAKKGKRQLLTTIIIIIALLYITITWVLPFFINGLGTITGIFKQSTKQESIAENPNLAPPIINIPYEATSSSKINITGFAASHSTVKIYLDDTLVGTTTAEDNGSFTLQDVSLSLGTNNIYGKTEDEKGKESLASKTIKVIFDNEKPPLEVNSPSDGQTIQAERKLNVSGKTEPNATVTINNEQAIVDSEGKFSRQFNLSDGSNTFTIVARDTAGNTKELARNVTFNP